MSEVTDEAVEAAALALAQSRCRRRGVRLIQDLAMLSPGLREDVEDEAREALSAALPLIVAGEREWQKVETMPATEGTRIRALVETELVMEEHVPSCLMGGWKRCAARDKIVGWKPGDPDGPG